MALSLSLAPWACSVLLIGNTCFQNTVRSQQHIEMRQECMCVCVRARVCGSLSLSLSLCVRVCVCEAEARDNEEDEEVWRRGQGKSKRNGTHALICILISRVGAAVVAARHAYECTCARVCKDAEEGRVQVPTRVQACDYGAVNSVTGCSVKALAISNHHGQGLHTTNSGTSCPGAGFRWMHRCTSSRCFYVCIAASQSKMLLLLLLFSVCWSS